MQSSSKHSRVEDRVDRVREALSSKLLNTADDDGITTTAAVVLAEEARRSRELSVQLGPRAYLLKHNDSGKYSSEGAYSELRKVSDVNKNFLQNTIRSVESHNRREQIDGAWRQHGLLKKLEEGSVLRRHSSSGGDRAHTAASTTAASSVDHPAARGGGQHALNTGSSSVPHTKVVQVEDDQMDPLSMRQLWAARKAAVFSSHILPEEDVKDKKRCRDSSSDSSDSDNNSTCSNSTTSEVHKKKRKRKKEKKLKKKKKSKKEKKHKSK